MSIQRFYGAKLYFNTLVPWGEGKIKYGVIDRWERKYIESSSQRSQFRKDLLLDLMDWQTLYTAGRSSPKHDHYLHLCCIMIGCTSRWISWKRKTKTRSWRRHWEATSTLPCTQHFFSFQVLSLKFYVVISWVHEMVMRWLSWLSESDRAFKGDSVKRNSTWHWLGSAIQETLGWSWGKTKTRYSWMIPN